MGSNPTVGSMSYQQKRILWLCRNVRKLVELAFYSPNEIDVHLHTLVKMYEAATQTYAIITFGREVNYDV